MKRFILIILVVFCFILSGCATTYTSDEIKRIREDAREEGYEAGYEEGYREAMYECGDVVSSDIREAGLIDAEEHASMIETILDSPEDFDINEIWEHINAVRSFLYTVEDYMSEYEEHGIDLW